MALVASKLAYVTFADDEGQRVQTSFRLANGATDVEANALIDATIALAKGLVVERGITSRQVEDTVVVASDPYAQTDIRWRVSYTEGGTGRNYTTTIGTADYSGVRKLANSEAYNPANAQWQAFIAAFNAAVIGPEGNAVTFVDATSERV